MHAPDASRDAPNAAPTVAHPGLAAGAATGQGHAASGKRAIAAAIGANGPLLVGDPRVAAVVDRLGEEPRVATEPPQGASPKSGDANFGDRGHHHPAVAAALTNDPYEKMRKKQKKEEDIYTAGSPGSSFSSAPPCPQRVPAGKVEGPYHGRGTGARTATECSPCSRSPYCSWLPRAARAFADRESLEYQETP